MENADIMIISISLVSNIYIKIYKFLVFRGNQRNNDPDQVDLRSVNDFHHKKINIPSRGKHIFDI